MTTDDATEHTDVSSAAGPELGWQLTRLLDGFIVTQLLYVVARLDVVSALSTGPRTGAELASAVGAETRPLTRVMRGLVAEGVFSQDAAGRFALTPLGAALGGLRRCRPRPRRAVLPPRRGTVRRRARRRCCVRAHPRRQLLRSSGRTPRSGGRVPGVDGRSRRQRGRSRRRRLRLQWLRSGSSTSAADVECCSPPSCANTPR